MSIKTGIFCSLTFSCIIIYSDCWYIIDHYCIMENFQKNRGKKKRSEQYALKIKNILRTANLGSNFTGSYKKECTSTGRRKPLQCNQRSTLSFW